MIEKTTGCSSNVIDSCNLSLRLSLFADKPHLTDRKDLCTSSLLVSSSPIQHRYHNELYPLHYSLSGQKQRNFLDHFDDTAENCEEGCCQANQVCGITKKNFAGGAKKLGATPRVAFIAATPAVAKKYKKTARLGFPCNYRLLQSTVFSVSHVLIVFLYFFLMSIVLYLRVAIDCIVTATDLL